MESKPKLTRLSDGTWMCESPGTPNGYGTTPQLALSDWLTKFNYKVDIPITT